MVAARSNLTLVRGVLGAFTPATDGYGGEIALEVLGNLSPAQESDFLRPKAGDDLIAFTAQAPSLDVGTVVDVRLSFIGGPFGGRAVVQEIIPFQVPEKAPGTHRKR